jgi:hypothetical protein
MKRVEEIMAELKALDTCGCGDYAGLAGEIADTFNVIAETILDDVKRGIKADNSWGKGTHDNAMEAYFKSEKKLRLARCMFQKISVRDDDYDKHCGLTARRCFRIFNVATQKFVTDRHSDINRVGESMLKYINRISKLVGNIRYR